MWLSRRKKRALKLAILRRDGNRCYHCHGKMRFEETMRNAPDFATFEHLTPLSKGGHPTALSNLALAHKRCNNARGDSPLNDESGGAA